MKRKKKKMLSFLSFYYAQLSFPPTDPQGKGGSSTKEGRREKEKDGGAGGGEVEEGGGEEAERSGEGRGKGQEGGGKKTARRGKDEGGTGWSVGVLA